ncbi:deoxyribose-phosphate aldolase [uncultured Georgenia sp.]|uniref:Cgl0159 family (beta/alpha)8-fold protein n=1 Tax=uncultured Georgenia sp. TaxID=378209 RepID=UPI0026120BD4|nr:deoxyribose-phosphate aldolase [uncultured Georgenia sp.]HLV03882.1 deoxyribose-phosphate aldolase [Actinomycetaceae bacterium]
MLTVEEIRDLRMHEPERVARALAQRPRGRLPGPGERLMVIAADHPARGSLAVGHDPMAMGDRRELLRRCVAALARPGVHGFLGTPDLVEDLTLLGALDGKLVYGSMNRGGLRGAGFEMDDRFTGYTVRAVVDSGLDGGKVLLRIDPQDPGSLRTLESTAHAVDALAASRRVALVEPFLSRRVEGRSTNVLTTEAVVTAVAIAAGLGGTSAYTWLKVPLVPDMEAVAAASTLPTLVLGGEVGDDVAATVEGWARALRVPGIRGLVLGRTLLYPPDDDVEGAVDRAVALL